ncbi:AT-rich interactive domain-containing protein 6-like [Mangifera indica]|uniref:AT-rich interactive domain-containing protein 6-like n=1 Tax=Mangifera indica TaxID=29780 RepID=UPI001CFB624A|nr:AT-rich interactive domain-containing protein 6-like [Mangifera indica]XP_044488645.1 AT-rich interactive domain-containing protein 6-like [Mangifera indica]
MSDSETGGVKKEKGKEDMEEDVNMNDKNHQLEAKDPPSSEPENGDATKKVKDADVKSIGLATDGKPAVVNNQTLADVQPCDNVDGLNGKDEDAKMETVDNNDKADESIVDDKNLVKFAAAAKVENDAAAVDETANELSHSKNDGDHELPLNPLGCVASDLRSSEIKAEIDEKDQELNGVTETELSPNSEVKESNPNVDVGCEVGMKSSNLSFLYEPPVAEGNESGTEEEQIAFVKEVENFYKERSLEFKHPKFYKEDLNLLKLWRAVIKLGGYEEVTSCKLWRQVGESFNPPKTCTTVSWTFRIFYEKALLEYEKHRLQDGEHSYRDVSLTEPSRIESQSVSCQGLGSGRARRDAAARAMQGWHSKRLLGSGEVCQPIIKEKNSSSTPKSDRQIKNIGMLKRKKPSSVEHTVHISTVKGANSQSDTMVLDIGPPADWVKINVQRTSDCFEVYALVPGLLREEVHVQSDPAGRLVISGQPEQLDNPWGVTPFKKVVSLPSRIDPHQTSAVVTLHGQLFVRVPFEQSDP